MKKIIEKVIAGVLAVIMACQFQVPTFAASEEKTYVSEVIISYGEGDAAESDAKQWLTDNGYSYVDTNLNAGAESGASNKYISWATGARSARAVYLGYKTTSDPSQAITSLKTMNMTGNYSYASYQEVLDQLKDEIQIFMEDLEITLGEWRANYKAGRGKAVEVYEILNLMYSPDNNNAKMGDLLLNETKEELGDDAYNKLSDEEKLQHADMTTILMQGNSDATLYIEQLLAMGADTDTSSTWLDRLSKIGTYDDMMDAKEAEAEQNNQTFSPSIADAELATQYDEAAKQLAEGITRLQSLFQEYIDSGSILKEEDSKVENYLNKISKFTDAQSQLNIGVLYEALASYKYPSADNPDRTLQDFFMQKFDYTDSASVQDLYPMAAALSDGQRKALPFVSLTELITQGILTDAEALSSINDIKEELAKTEQVSVFAGVDRSIYDSSSTALTSSARELQNSSQKSYTEGMFGSPFSIQTTIVAAVFAVSLAATVTCGIITGVLAYKTAPGTAYMALVERHYQEYLGKPFAETTEEYALRAMAYDQVMADVGTVNGGGATAVVQEASESIKGYESALRYDFKDELYASRAKLLKGFKIATGVLVVVTIALGVWTVISGIKDLKAYYNRDMDLYPIPDNIVDEQQTDTGNMVYTYYKAVQSNRVEKGYTTDREALKDNADLNGDLGKEWLALYYTKDTAAGYPIMVSDISGFQVVKGSEATPADKVALTIFDQENPVNLTSEDWVWNDVNGGLYLYYTVDKASYSASVFTEANMWIVYVGAGVVIAAIFFLGGFFMGKKKKRKSGMGEIPA